MFDPIVTKAIRIRIVAISGSLRQASTNTALVEAAAQLAVAAARVTIYRGLAQLPPFNPDLESGTVPDPVLAFRAVLAACDAVIISSPEYAHGVPGVLKNALDWIVGSGELMGKPVAVVNASPHATRAWASLSDTLTVMSARVIFPASIVVPVQGRAGDADAIVRDPELASLLRSAIATLAASV